MSRLKIIAGPERVGETFLLGGPGPIEIGKLSSKPLQLTGTLVSRSHARLVRDGERWAVQDLASTNGLFVNDQRVTAQPLQEGDRVRIGEYTLEYHTTADAEALPAEELELVEDAAALRPAQNKQAATDTDDYVLTVSEEELKQPAPRPTVRFAPPPGAPEGPGVPCPSCGRTLSAGTKICARCGIYIDTGRPLLTAREGEIESFRSHIEASLRVLALFLWLGIFPIASEAYGRRRPYAIWAIAAITVIVSVWFGYCQRYRPGSMHDLKMLMLWGGSAPTPEMVDEAYRRGEIDPEWDFGDPNAFERAKAQVKAEKVSEDMVPVVAYERLPVRDRSFGEFQWYQLFTHALLHGGWLHLIGNLVFLIVLGSRVNALIGNVATAIIYPILAVAAAGAQLLSSANGPPAPMLGASGAIMGLAGMYFVLFPLYRMYVAAWFLPFWVKVGTTRGFVILLFYISFDILYTLLGSEDGVAHWAHLGGFIAGMLIAIVLLATRAINAYGGDLLSIILGRRGWVLIGSPAQWQEGDGEGWFQRLRGKPKKSPEEIATAPPLPAQPLVALAAAPSINPQALPPRRIAEPAPVVSREEVSGQRAIAIAKWTWPLLIILPILAWKYWPDPAFVYSQGATIKHPPKQVMTSGGKWWRHNGCTLTPLADYEVEGVVLSKAGYNDEVSQLSQFDLILGWGAMSDPQVISAISFRQMERSFEAWATALPSDVPYKSLINQFANFSTIPANDAIAKQIAAVPVGKTIILTGKLVQVNLPNGQMWQSGTKAASIAGSVSRVIWIDQLTIK